MHFVIFLGIPKSYPTLVTSNGNQTEIFLYSLFLPYIIDEIRRRDIQQYN